MAAAMAGRATPGQKFRLWVEDKFTPKERPTNEEPIAQLRARWLGAHKGVAHEEEDSHEHGEAGSAARGQYL
jgi:hypothetical protein